MCPADVDFSAARCDLLLVAEWSSTRQWRCDRKHPLPDDWSDLRALVSVASCLPQPASLNTPASSDYRPSPLGSIRHSALVFSMSETIARSSTVSSTSPHRATR